MDMSDGKKLAQEQKFAGAVLDADPQGQLIFVDSVSGNDGKNGDNPREALLTLTRAVAKSQAGDTIILNKGGSETITAGLSLSLARVKVICKTDNPRSGFTLQGAGTLDLITVSAADCHIEGIEFKHTGTTANAACVQASADASGLVVKTCSFDDTAISSTKTGIGIELVAGADDQIVDNCVTTDAMYGVQIAASSTNESDRTTIRNCKFYVGGSEFFGIHAAAGTGKVQGLRVEKCVWFEADGDGSAASNAWDGTDGTNATQGPIMLGAAVDQFVVERCTAYTALATSFDLINAIDSGAAGDMIANSTGEGGDLEDKIDLINPNTNTKVTSGEVVIAAAITSGEVIVNANTDSKVTSGEVIVNANTASKVTSGEVVIAAAITSGEVIVNANTDSKVTSGEVIVNANTDSKVTSGEVVINANTTSKVTSGEVVVAAAITSGEVIVNANTDSKVTSGEVVINANTTSKVTSGEVVIAAAITSGEVIVNANTDSKVTSGEVIVNANTDSKVTSGEVVINANTDSKVTSGEVVINANTTSKVTSGEVVVAAAITSGEVIVNANTDSKVTSGEVVINANTTSKVTSGEVVINANTTSKVTSGEVVIAAAITSGEVIVNANTDSKVTSGEVIVNANTDSKVTSGEVVIAAAITSGEVIVNANTDSKVTSGEVVIAAAITSGEVIVNAQVTAKGRPIAVTKTFDLASIPNNAQSFALFTASGTVFVEEIIFSKDGTNLEAMTNLEMTCNNAYGPTGLASDLFANIKAGLLANLTLLASAGGVTAFTPMVLEDTKILYLHGDDGAGTGGSNLQATLRGYALSDGATVS